MNGTETIEIDSSSNEEMSDQEEPELSESDRLQLGQERKEEGNKCYQNKDYLAALRLYTEAINFCPNCAAYYGNRSATNMMLNRYDSALADARKAVQLDHSFIKGHLREAKCHLNMGSIPAAVSCYERVLSLEPASKAARAELEQARHLKKASDDADKAYAQADFRTALYFMDRCLSVATACSRYKIFKAECLALLRRYSEALDIINDLLRQDSKNADAIYIRGVCLYQQDNLEKAFQHFQQVLKLAPDHEKSRAVYRKAKALVARKEEGNAAFRSGKLEEALNLYTDALKVDPQNVFVNSKIYCNRATVLSKLKRFEEAIQDCSKAIELDSTYLKAYMRRAKCYLDSELYEEAVREYEKIFQMDSTRENKRALQDAKLELKKSQRKDYYKILGVSKDADDDEIKKAYRKRALLHHPDTAPP